MAAKIEEFRPRLTYTDRFVTVLRNVFSESECQALIELSEKQDYTPATVTRGGRQILLKYHRDSDRVLINDAESASQLFQRIAPFLPQKLKGGYTLAGINERLRFLRYGERQKFAPHFDGCYESPDGSQISFLTVQLYLNGGPGQLEGGETCFLDDNKQVQYKVEPCAGLVLVFDHLMRHEGASVQGGRKYCIRSDVMYRKETTLGPMVTAWLLGCLSRILGKLTAPLEWMMRKVRIH